VAIGALFLIGVFNTCMSLVDLAFLPYSLSSGLYHVHSVERDLLLTPLQLLLGLLLLTAGRLALTGGSQYQQWRQAQIDRRRE
jgi:hypothetical protein